ncbi:MAG TPA: NADP-dependent isocitrate dehydrogenase [Desulfonatronum sp.]|nr:NADP-dependent isocitrate dehydrogenase [Desulfonatronum sp.]
MQEHVYFIEGDGIGPEVFAAARPVIDAAVAKAYADSRKLKWIELLAGEKAHAATGEYLPQATLNTLQQAELALKGPLATPVGKGFRSLNVTLRQTLDLYACIRPIRYFQGVASPVKRPELVNMVVFRENTEDVYAGIEWAAGSPEAARLIAFLRDEMHAVVDPSAAIGIKPMTAKGSKRLVRRSITFALDQGRSSVTLVHKGNIMKFTEGGFRSWGYAVAAQEFAEQTVTETEQDAAPGKLVIKDRIADAMFQEVLLRPEQYDVIATSNLNGDYLSDALAAQVGGLGLAPGVNMSDTLAFFEATHGTAPGIAGKDLANPGSLILCGAMLLDHIGWHEAADMIHTAMHKTIAARSVTQDLATQIPGACAVGCRQFGELIAQHLA